VTEPLVNTVWNMWACVVYHLWNAFGTPADHTHSIIWDLLNYEFRRMRIGRVLSSLMSSKPTEEAEERTLSTSFRGPIQRLRCEADLTRMSPEGESYSITFGFMVQLMSMVHKYQFCPQFSTCAMALESNQPRTEITGIFLRGKALSALR
jgi:hypothetical protein